MELLSKFIERWYNNKTSIFIHVIGDAILDQDYEVKVSRISPECPNVNILLSETDEPVREYPGGAANVCFQLANFDLVSRLFCFIDKEAFKVIRKKLKYWCCLELPEGYYVPRKKRYYDKGFQVVARRDIEKPNYGLDTKTLQKRLLELYLIYQYEPDAIIFSDYNKGVFSNDFGIKDFPEHITKCITVVDPKKNPIERWYGCTVFKPNKSEAFELSGLVDWKEQCDFFQSKLNCKAVVITQEGDGIVGKDKGYFEYRLKNKINPVDIVGAGDCFAGIFTLALILGFSYEESAIIAFHSGLLYVQQKRKGMFGPWSFGNNGKIIKNIDILKNRDYKLVFTNGCFDLLHGGHIESLRLAKLRGDKLIVAVNSDKSVKKLKGESRPILPLEERIKILSELESVDFIISFDEDDPEHLIKEILPDVIVKGEDWKDKKVAGMEYAKEMYYTPSLYSTSQIIQKIIYLTSCSNPHTDKTSQPDNPCSTCNPHTDKTSQPDNPCSTDKDYKNT